MKRRVVVVGRGAPERGGIPSFLDMLVREGHRLGDEVALVNLAPGGSGRGGRLSLSNSLRTLGDGRRLVAEVQRGDVVHLHSAFAPTVTAIRAGLLVLAARAAGGRTVVHVHGGRLADKPPNAVRRGLIRATLASAQLVIAVATGVHRVLLDAGVDPSRVRLLRNGVDLDRFSVEHTIHPVPRILFAGGITPRKGVLDLMAASQRLLDRGLPHELWLAGGVPDEGLASYHEVLREVPDHCVMLGPLPLDDMPPTYAQADIFCLPSWWEAMPLTVLEAQASGMPVVATDVGDVSEMILPGRTGMLVPPRDVTALTDALAALLEDEELRTRMGQEARRHVSSSFGQTRLLDELADAFDSLRGTR